jgi:hypothetical protein
VSLFPFSGTVTHGGSEASHHSLSSNPNWEGPQHVGEHMDGCEGGRRKRKRKERENLSKKRRNKKKSVEK